MSVVETYPQLINYDPDVYNYFKEQFVGHLFHRINLNRLLIGLISAVTMYNWPTLRTEQFPLLMTLEPGLPLLLLTQLRRHASLEGTCGVYSTRFPKTIVRGARKETRRNTLNGRKRDKNGKYKNAICLGEPMGRSTLGTDASLLTNSKIML